MRAAAAAAPPPVLVLAHLLPRAHLLTSPRRPVSQAKHAPLINATLPREAWTMNVHAVEGSAEDRYRFNPWRAPGSDTRSDLERGRACWVWEHLGSRPRRAQLGGHAREAVFCL